MNTPPTKPPIKIPRQPHMPQAGIDRLTDMLRDSRCYLEYGAGGSTMLAARLGVPTIVTVESDAAFLDQMREAVAATGTASTVHFIHADIGPTRNLGFPADNSGVQRWPNYALGAWVRLAELQMMPDLVLIDGRFRVACALASLLHLPEGTPILLDDYVGREQRYDAITRHVPIAEIVGVGALLRAAPAGDPAALAHDLASFCVNPA